MRRSIAAAVFLLVAVIAGCATGTPTVDAEPAATAPAVAETMPLEWFAENWGPFDASPVGPRPDGPGGYPLLIQDGIQVTPGTEMRGDVFAALTDPVSDGGFLEVRVFKHRCDTRHFGAAGAYGIIMVFSTDYEGPLPEAGHRWDGSPCDRDRP